MQFAARHRPSGPMAISLLALFVALGGVGWAATQLPANSVGAVQLKNGAVTEHKLATGAVGAAEIRAGQVQARVRGTCAAGGAGAIGAIDRRGTVHCNATLPRAFGARSQPVTIGAASTLVLSKALGSGTYLAFANPYALVLGGVAGQEVLVTCTLAVGGRSQTRSANVEVRAPGGPIDTAIPLSVQAPRGAGAMSADLRCSEHSSAGAAPAVQVVAGIDALQVGSIG
jgi:hypothetical protein